MGTYTYPAAGQPRPHAVTGITGTFNGITNPSFAYDANGNMTNRASSGANITWFSYNYPAAISATDVTGSEEVEFSYGPDRQRWEQIYSGPSGTEKTYYIGGLIDLVFNGSTTNYRQYIYAGSEPVAFYSRTSAGTNTINYVTGDFQGSESTIRSNAGVGGINESFTAFGSRRNPNTWSGAPAASDLTTIAGISRQGYTFQTALGQSMGLNHMNGRVQDAILGRFLSPDPHITDPTNAQSYNRYSYVNNNPLTLIDPTGFDDTNENCVGGGGPCPPPTSQPPPDPSQPMLPPYVVPVPCNGMCGPDIPFVPPPSIQTPPFAFGGPVGGGQAPTLPPIAPQSTPMNPPCMRASAAQSNQNSNITTGAAAGFSIAAVAGGVFVANLIGFPEVEVGEAGVGAADLILILTDTRGADAIAVGAVNAGAYGATVGGAVGAALPSGGCNQ